MAGAAGHRTCHCNVLASSGFRVPRVSPDALDGGNDRAGFLSRGCPGSWLLRRFETDAALRAIASNWARAGRRVWWPVPARRNIFALIDNERLAAGRWWSQRPRTPRARLFAAVGRACVEAGRANTYPSSFGSWHSSDCPSEIGSMLPHDLTTLTRQEGFALMYAALALNPISVDRVLSRVSSEVALAMLHGLHASELHTPVRRQYLRVGVDCPTLHRLADIAC